jgi:hypothetical protein
VIEERIDYSFHFFLFNLHHEEFSKDSALVETETKILTHAIQKIESPSYDSRMLISSAALFQNVIMRKQAGGKNDFSNDRLLWT